jgi:hypothetical protein
MTALRSCRVELIGRVEAMALIMKFEPLRTLGQARLFFELRAPDSRLIGACGFGWGINRFDACAVLERGFCTRDAPRNSASYLIGRALRYGRRFLGWRVVRAYSDERFGEAGIVYRAANFRPLPSRHGPYRYETICDGRQWSDRATRRRFGSHAAARAAGASIVCVPARRAWQWSAP